MDTLKGKVSEFINNCGFDEGLLPITFVFGTCPPEPFGTCPPEPIYVSRGKTTIENILGQIQSTGTDKTDIFHAEWSVMQRLEKFQKDSFIKDRKQYFLLITDERHVDEENNLDWYVEKCPLNFRDKDKNKELKEYEEFYKVARKLKFIKKRTFYKDGRTIDVEKDEKIDVEKDVDVQKKEDDPILVKFILFEYTDEQRADIPNAIKYQIDKYEQAWKDPNVRKEG